MVKHFLVKWLGWRTKTKALLSDVGFTVDALCFAKLFYVTDQHKAVQNFEWEEK